MSYRELWRAAESYGEFWRAMGKTLKKIIVCLLKCFGELWTAIESYKEPLVNKFIIHLNTFRIYEESKELRRAMESYDEIQISMKI